MRRNGHHSISIFQFVNIRYRGYFLFWLSEKLPPSFKIFYILKVTKKRNGQNHRNNTNCSYVVRQKGY